MLKQIYSVPFDATTLSHFVNQGSYSKFYLIYRGDNAVGLDTTLADLGNVLFLRNGNPLMNVPASLLSSLNNVYGGFATFSNVTGGAVLAVIEMPCGMFADKNNVYSLREREAQIKLDFSALASLWDSGTVEIYSVEQTGIESYQYKLVNNELVAGGAGVKPDSYTVDNVVNAIITNSTLISRIQLTKDKMLIVDSDTDVAKAQSDLEHQLEASPSGLIVFEFLKSNDLRDSVSNEIHYNFTFTGAGTLLLYFGSLIFSSDKTLQSISVAKTTLENKISKANNIPSVIGGAQLDSVQIISR